MGFYYHITVVNVDNPVERYWDSSVELSSLQLMTDDTKESPFHPSVTATSPERMTVNDLTKKYFNSETWPSNLPSDDVVVDDEEEEEDDDVDQSWASSFVKRKADGISGTSSTKQLNATTNTSGETGSVDTRGIVAIRRPLRGYGTRNVVSIAKKLEVLAFIEAGNSRYVASRHFGIPRSTIRTIVKNREKIEAYSREGNNLDRSKVWLPRNHVLDEPLLEWYGRMKAMNVPVSGPLIQDQALQIAEKLGIDNFVASNGWLNRFKMRHNIWTKSLS